MSNTSILSDWFELDGETVMWKKAGRGIPLDRIARTRLEKNGYVYLWCRGKRFLLHRVKFFLKYGYAPEYIDHVDGNPLNNDFHNIREATNQQNLRNMSKRSNATSRFKGVCRKRNKWRAYIAVDSKQINLGVFVNEEDAARAYNQKAIELFGEFAKVNNVGS
ncbi:putative homing endonuclease [Cronobacter phage vB_CsaP_GAP52]|uniref:Putative homing endonuclease n=1 Tax=Cronobacter phage vB_CsaP_GAP52 TaxID=1141137 RepID=K4FBB5_9CAUD|nr:putative homing endonuclease [Cronobacter phage vB_CsaP_GAP52]AFC22054.1 putative homing endonuclease [Cronobacter phage vB_CsaP_GAP52]